MQEREEKLKQDRPVDQGQLRLGQKIYYGVFMCWGAFTAIPCPNKVWHEEARLAMLAMLQILGAVLGWLGLLLLLLMFKISLPGFLMAAILAIYPMFVTGFIHVDGFMDSCDAIGSRAGPDKVGAILKDSRVGAFAVIGIVVVVLINFAALACLVETNMLHTYSLFLPMSMAASRWNAGRAVALSEPMSGSQYRGSSIESSGARRKFKIYHSLIFLILLLPSMLALRLTHAYFMIYKLTAIYPCLVFLGIILLAGLLQGLAIRSARKTFGGMNGDISGYSIVIAETVANVLFAIAAENFMIGYLTY